MGKQKARPGRELQIHGSGQLAYSLISAGLVDELRLMLAPVTSDRGAGCLWMSWGAHVHRLAKFALYPD